jgi:hypothetical protein
MACSTDSGWRHSRQVPAGLRAVLRHRAIVRLRRFVLTRSADLKRRERDGTKGLAPWVSPGLRSTWRSGVRKARQRIGCEPSSVAAARLPAG